MREGDHDLTSRRESRITVQATDIDGIPAALGMELVEEPESAESPDYPESYVPCSKPWLTSTEASRRP